MTKQTHRNMSKTNETTQATYVPLTAQQYFWRGLLGLMGLLLAVTQLTPMTAAQAQAATNNGGVWLNGLNLSRSGTGSQPIVAAGGNAISHVMWWDSFDGIRYARLTSTLSGTLDLSATTSIPLVNIFGDRQTYFDNRLRKQVTEIRPPRDLRLLSDKLGTGHVIWENLSDQLLYAASAGNVPTLAWTAPTLVEQNASAFDATTDVSNTLHIAYVRLGNNNQPGAAAAGGGQPGLYYRTRVGGALSAPIAILPSNYLRAERADNLALSIAANARGSIAVTWFQPSQSQSFYVVSTDSGKTWSQPQAVSGGAAQLAIRSSVAATPQGDLLLLYRDNSGKGCAFNQRRSSDGGRTWDAPQIVLTDVTRCPQRWRFANTDDKLWMIGSSSQAVSPLATNTTNNINTNLLVSWDGSAWSPSAEINLRTFDSTSNQSRQLSCLNISLAGNKLLGVGCDPRGDIWSSQVTINLNDLIKAPELVWQRVAPINKAKGAVGDDVALAGQPNNMIGLWTQSDVSGAPPNEVDYSRWNGDEWSQPSKIMNAARGRFEQLSLAAAPDERLHLAWTNDRVYYSTSFMQDAGVPEGWTKPIAIPSPVEGNRAPSLVADPRGSVVYVAYAVPFNEKRGIYLAQSKDNGATWQPASLIFDAAAAQWESVDQPALQLDPQRNVLHAAWLKTNQNPADPEKALYYAQSSDGGKTWSKPQEMASGDIHQPQIAISGAGQLHLIWAHTRGVFNTGVPYEANSRFSPDGGQQWSEAALIPGFGELANAPKFTSDGNGQVFLTAMGENASGESSLIYAQWNGQSWSMAESLGVGQRSTEGNAASVAVLPASGQLVVLMRTFILSDTGNSQFGLLSTSRRVNISKAQPQAQATFTPVPTPTSTEPTIATATDVPKPVIPTDIPKELQPQPTISPAITQTAIIVIVVVGVLLILFGFYKNRRQ